MLLNYFNGVDFPASKFTWCLIASPKCSTLCLGSSHLRGGKISRKEAPAPSRNKSISVFIRMLGWRTLTATATGEVSSLLCDLKEDGWWYSYYRGSHFIDTLAVTLIVTVLSQLDRKLIQVKSKEKYTNLHSAPIDLSHCPRVYWILVQWQPGCVVPSKTPN